MRVLGVNRILNWLQIVDSKIYTCPTKEVNGELLFRYKNKWHRAIDYSYEKTDELYSENGKTLSRIFKG